MEHQPGCGCSATNVELGRFGRLYVHWRTVEGPVSYGTIGHNGLSDGHLKRICIAACLRLYPLEENHEETQ
jgi:hypothetical protein